MADPNHFQYVSTSKFDIHGIALEYKLTGEEILDCVTCYIFLGCIVCISLHKWIKMMRNVIFWCLCCVFIDTPSGK